MKRKSHGRSCRSIRFTISCDEKQNISAIMFGFCSKFKYGISQFKTVVNCAYFYVVEKNWSNEEQFNFYPKFTRLTWTLKSIVLVCESNFSYLVCFTVKKTMGLIDTRVKYIPPFQFYVRMIDLHFFWGLNCFHQRLKSEKALAKFNHSIPAWFSDIRCC